MTLEGRRSGASKSYLVCQYSMSLGLDRVYYFQNERCERVDGPTILLVLHVGHIPQSSSTQGSKWQTARRSHGCNSSHVALLFEEPDVVMLGFRNVLGGKCQVISDTVLPRRLSRIRDTEW